MGKQKAAGWNKKKHTAAQLRELRANDTKHKRPQKPNTMSRASPTHPPIEPKPQSGGKRALFDTSTARKTVRGNIYAKSL